MPTGTTVPRPLRVLIGADTCPPDINGADRFTARLAAGLTGREHEVHVVAPSDTGAASSPVQEDGVTAVRRPRSYRVPDQDRFRACLPGPAAAGAQRVVRPDVVRAQSHLQVGRGLLAAAFGVGYPTVATNHSMPENVPRRARVPAVLADRAWLDLARVHSGPPAVHGSAHRASPSCRAW